MKYNKPHFLSPVAFLISVSLLIVIGQKFYSCSLDYSRETLLNKRLWSAGKIFNYSAKKTWIRSAKWCMHMKCSQLQLVAGFAARDWNWSCSACSSKMLLFCCAHFSAFGFGPYVITPAFYSTSKRSISSRSGDQDLQVEHPQAMFWARFKYSLFLGQK